MVLILFMVCNKIVIGIYGVRVKDWRSNQHMADEIDIVVPMRGLRRKTRNKPTSPVGAH